MVIDVHQTEDQNATTLSMDIKDKDEKSDKSTKSKEDLEDITQSKYDDAMHWKLRDQTIHKSKSWWRGTWPLGIEIMSNVTNCVGTQTVDSQNVLASKDGNSKNVQDTTYLRMYL